MRVSLLGDTLCKSQFACKIANLLAMYGITRLIHEIPLTLMYCNFIKKFNEMFDKLCRRNLIKKETF